jgi:two-component system sensor histidine kinase UhpB
LAARISDLFHVHCQFDCAQPVLIEDKNIATQLYRIAQEAATNSIKHGRAKKISIGLSAPAELLILSISDDGVGFKKSSHGQPGLGMRIMSHRAGLIGGTLIVQKRAEGGVKVVCALAKISAANPNINDEQSTLKI